MSQEISFNREAALKAGYRLEVHWDDLIPGHEKEVECFVWKHHGLTIRQENYAPRDYAVISVQYLRHEGKGEYLMKDLNQAGVETDVF